MMEGLESALIVAALSILMFLIFREVICWYFKINERASLLKRIALNQEHLIRLASVESDARADKDIDFGFGKAGHNE